METHISSKKASGFAGMMAGSPNSFAVMPKGRSLKNLESPGPTIAPLRSL